MVATPKVHTQQHMSFFPLIELSTKYKIRTSNLCAQRDTAADSKHCHGVMRLHVNAIRTMLQLTLVTHGHFLRVRFGANKCSKCALEKP